ncbi:MAG: protein-glutamate O-methyltransferase CheR [Rhodospirillales bacterium]|nr:protein-glutamate O-methyltransferase CheR [Rhodospirillales bacterium]
MTAGEVALICDMLRRRSGLTLPPEKAYLLESRLRPVVRKYGLADLSALSALVARRNPQVVADVVDAMTTNETLFFRDMKPFSMFRDLVLPALLGGRAAQRSFRILCAGASSGQEPYSLAMILAEEAARLQGWRCEIVAIDISTTALERARAGVYSQFEVQRGLPTRLLLKYFRPVGDNWQIAEELRAMVRFRDFNLLNDLAPFGRCDVIFCRNMLIYFDPATKARTLQNIARRLPADGFVFLGASETTMGLTDALVPIRTSSGVYRPQAATGPAVAAVAPSPAAPSGSSAASAA